MLIAFSPARDATMKAYKQPPYQLRCQIYALKKIIHTTHQKAINSLTKNLLVTKMDTIWSPFGHRAKF